MQEFSDTFSKNFSAVFTAFICKSIEIYGCGIYTGFNLFFYLHLSCMFGWELVRMTLIVGFHWGREERIMGITEILTALLKIFILMLPGFILKKRKIITSVQTDGVASIITKTTYPCLVITAMQMEYSPKVLANCPYIFLVYAGVMLLAFLLAKGVGRLAALPAGRSQLLTFMLIFGNTGFIGLPVLNGLFGPEAVFYGAICDATCDVFLFTFGVAILRSAAASKQAASPAFRQAETDSTGSCTESSVKNRILESLKEIFNPCTIGVIIGLILYISRIQLPEIVGEPVALLGSATTPLAMFIIGSQLADIEPRSLFGDKHIYLGCFLKLLIMPAAALLLSYLVIGPDSLLSTVIIMEAAMPAAAVTVIFTQQFRGDVEFAAKGVLMSTLLCIFTIPIVAVILSML